MAAELLDIEAKLDTSQVQGQLSQLSKTSGLQNLDRVIRTLEQSMKKLAAQMDKASAQTSGIAGGGGGAGGSGGGMRLSSRAIRGVGVFMLANTIQSLADATGSSGLSRAGKYIGNAARGAATGGTLGGPIGAGVGFAVGLLQSGFEHLADTTKELNAAMAQLAQKYASNEKNADQVQKEYGERKWREQLQGKSGADLQKEKEAAAKELEAAQKRADQVQAALAEFRNTPAFKSVIESASKPGDSWLNQRWEGRDDGRDEEYVKHAAKLNDEYAKLVEEAQKWERNVADAKSHTEAVARREKEIEAEAQKRLEAEKKAREALERAQEALQKQLADYSHDKSMRSLSKRLQGMSLNDLRRGSAAAEERVNGLDSQYEKALEAAQDLKSLEDIAKAEEGLEKLSDQLKKAEQALGLWQDALEDAERAEKTREGIRSGAQSQLRQLRHQIGLEELGGRLDGMSQAEVQKGYEGAKTEFENQRAQLMASLGAQSVSSKPEEFADEIDNARTKMAELEDVMKLWQSRIEESAFNSNPLAAIGNMNQLEQAGYFGMASQDKTIEDLTQQILNYVRRITANTETQTSTNDETFGNY